MAKEVFKLKTHLKVSIIDKADRNAIHIIGILNKNKHPNSLACRNIQNQHIIIPACHTTH